jgi:MFS family permease
MQDFGEFRKHWRALLACFLGMGSALSVNSYILATFAPYMLDQFSWTQAQWARVQTVVMLAVICIPVAGYLADRIGVRKVAAIGILTFPLCLLAISQASGGISRYVYIYMIQTILCCTTTATIYTRVVAERFQRWRGLALAMCASSPAVVGLIGSPLLSAFVRTHGWRDGYVMVAVFSAICGAITLYLLPSSQNSGVAMPTRQKKSGLIAGVITKPIFWMMLIATMLVSLPASLVGGQLKLFVISQGASGDAAAALLVSGFAAGTLTGRLLSGLALDHFRPHMVAALFLCLPGAGLLMLASSLNSLPFLMAAVVLIGLAYGGEGDLIGYLVVRYFGIGVYSSVLGLLTAGIGAVSALGHSMQGYMLDNWNSYTPFVLLAVVCVFVGSVLFAMLGRFPVFDGEAVSV